MRRSGGGAWSRPAEKLRDPSSRGGEKQPETGPGLTQLTQSCGANLAWGSDLVTSFDRELNGLPNSLPGSPLAVLIGAVQVKGLGQGGSGSPGAKALAGARPRPAPALQGQKEAPAVRLLSEALPPGLANSPTLVLQPRTPGVSRESAPDKELLICLSAHGSSVAL